MEPASEQAAWAFAPYEGPQSEFMQLDIREAMLGGSAGPGKSLCLLMDPVDQIRVEDARWRRGEITASVGWAIHFRRTFPNLEQTIVRSLRYFPGIDSGAKYDKARHIWEFSSGYHYQFAQMEGENDYFNYGSTEFSWIGLDELTEFTEDQYMFMGTRLRSPDPVLQKMLRIRSATNPVGPGLLWVRKRFVDPAPEGRKIIRNWVVVDGKKIARERIFIPAKLSDNLTPGFREQYEAELRDKPAHIQKALLEGDWYVIANAFFANEWIRSVHVCEPFDIPPGWFKCRSGDYGYKNYSCILWWAVDPDGNAVCYRELYAKGHDGDQLAFRIREIEEEAGEWGPDGSRLGGPLDLSCFYSSGTIGPTIAESMFDVGVWWQKCTKNRLAGSQEFRRRLKSRSGPKRDIPGIRFFSTCRNAIRTIPALPSDMTNAEVPQDGGEDHCLHGDTLVITDRGTVPIRRLVGTSGRVLAPDGTMHPYVNCRLTRRDQKVVRLRFDDGARLVCTPDHRLMKLDGSWIEAGDSADTMIYARIPCGSKSSVEPINNSTASRTTSAGATFSVKAGDFIAWCGRRTSDLFRAASTFITSITIAPITRSTICLSNGPPRTLAITAASAQFGECWPQIFERPKLRRRHGIGVGQGTHSTRSWASSQRSPSKAGALSAAYATASLWIARGPERLRSVAITVARKIAGIVVSTTLPARAPNAALRSEPTDSASTQPAPVRAVRCVAVEPAGTADVYCLTVPGPEAFAVETGIIVSNCFDATYYFCMSRPLVPKEGEVRQAGYDDELAERRAMQRKLGGRYGYGGH